MRKLLVPFWFLPLLIFVLSFSKTFGQYQKHIDSLTTIIETTKVDTLKVDLLNRVGRLYNTSNTDSSILYTEKGIKLAKKIDYPRGISYGYLFKASALEDKGDYDEAINTLKEGITVLDNYDFPKGSIELNTWIAINYRSQSKYDSAEAYINNSILKAKKINYYQGLITAYLSYGIILKHKNEYESSISYFVKVDSICSAHDISSDPDCASAVAEIGTIKARLGAYDEAIEYHENAIAYYEKLGTYDEGIITSKFSIAEIELNRKNLDIAEKYYNEIRDYYENSTLSPKLAYIYHSLGKLHRMKSEFDVAEEMAKMGLEYSIQYKDSIVLTHSYIELGRINVFAKEHADAVPYFTKGLELSKKREDARTAKTATVGLAHSYYNTGDYKKAADYYKAFGKLSDSLNAAQNTQVTLELEKEYQTEKKEQEIALLSARNKLSEQRQKIQQYLFIGILGLFLAIAGLLFFGYRNKLKTAKKMKELDTLKSRFFANISHEFRTPLTLIKSPVQQLKATADKTAQKQLNLIDNNADRMLELVDQLLELSKIESGRLKIILKKGNISSFIDTLVELFTFQAKEKGIPFEVDMKASDDLHYFDRDILTKIIVNLLSNAFKYREKGIVTFGSRITNEKLELKISNFNNQVKENDLRKFFERFYQNDSSSVGFGIGLALVKDLVAVNEGTINARLDNGKVIISVEIPLRKDLKNAVVIEETTDSDSSTNEQGIEVESDGIPVVLIADDNPEIRDVLREILKNDFHILEARDGKEAFELAQNEIPDCIISDVMMPNMDGFALVQMLKEDELTASAPVVLLTARASDESHLQGLQNHADAYLTKPFNHQIVKATVGQLLQERKKLQERYSRELILRPLDIAVSTADERFIKRLETVLSVELTNPDFTTDNFAEQMNMSRMQLHRKLKCLLGVSATEFVRSERLKAAAELLKNPRLSVADVAYSTGFNEVSYFSKRFRNLYGLSPSDFRKSI